MYTPLSNISPGASVKYKGKDWVLVSSLFANIPYHYISIKKDNEAETLTVPASDVSFNQLIDPDAVMLPINFGSDDGFGYASYIRPGEDWTKPVTVYALNATHNKGNASYNGKTYNNVVQFNAQPSGRSGDRPGNIQFDMPKNVYVKFNGDDIIKVTTQSGGRKSTTSRNLKCTYKRTEHVRQIMTRGKDGKMKKTQVTVFVKNGKQYRRKKGIDGKFHYVLLK